MRLHFMPRSSAARRPAQVAGQVIFEVLLLLGTGVVVAGGVLLAG
jgi:hypothetical protein